MTLPSDPARSPQGGITLLETMVVLSILTLVLVAVSTGFRGPSPALQARGLASEVIATASEARQQAIRTGEPKQMEVSDYLSDCDGDAPEPPVFYADGSMFTESLCVETEGYVLEISTDRLTGRVWLPE